MHVMTNSRGGGKEGKLRACSRFKRKKDEDADSVPKEKREEEEEKIFFSHKIRIRNYFISRQGYLSNINIKQVLMAE